MDKREFFIGWSDDMPERNKKALRKVLIPLFLLVPFFAFAVVYFMKPFNDHQFEFGNIKVFTGIYFENPFPVIILDPGQAPAHCSASALLVGYGKRGATGLMQNIARVKGPLSGKHLKIQGTLIYGDGKTLIELSRGENTRLEILDESSMEDTGPSKLQPVELHGEIMDPKCWFGVMKPGEGKVHKSCAIRCVSGGIPPVFRVERNGERKYYVLRGESGQDIRREILQLIAEPVTIHGNIYEQHGWSVLNTDPKSIQY